MITIEVRGVPAPQGSKRHVGGGRIIEQVRGVAPWREAVRHETQHQVPEGQGFARGVAVAAKISFRLPRPVSLPKKVLLPTRKKNDADKLLRAVLDGLVAGGALVDDGQVTHGVISKRFASDILPAGCRIVLTEDFDLEAD